MSFTAVQLCNLALTRVGGNRISSLSEDSESAILCNLMYDIVYESVLATYTWNCSTKRVRLAQLSTEPAFEYSYAYQLPTSPKCIRVFSTYPKTEYRIENGQLLCNLDEIYIKYAAKINESELDAHVAFVIVAKLAVELSNRVAQDINLKMELRSEYKDVLLEAKMIDGAGSKEDETGRFDWLEAGWNDNGDEVVEDTDNESTE